MPRKPSAWVLLYLHCTWNALPLQCLLKEQSLWWWNGKKQHWLAHSALTQGQRNSGTQPLSPEMPMGTCYVFVYVCGKQFPLSHSENFLPLSHCPPWPQSRWLFFCRLKATLHLSLESGSLVQNAWVDLHLPWQQNRLPPLTCVEISSQRATVLPSTWCLSFVWSSPMLGSVCAFVEWLLESPWPEDDIALES